MNIVQVLQGSPEWLALRTNYITASEAPCIVGISKYKTRTQLLHEKSTGIAQEVDAATQKRFDAGHAAEDAARGIVGSMLGAELFPVTATLEVDGLPLLASFDGVDIGETIVWESKLSNGSNANLQETIDEQHWPQLEVQMLVAGIPKVYFTVSDGTESGTRGVYYESQPDRRKQVLGAIKQFAKDLAAYQPPMDAPTPVASTIEALPALTIRVEGKVLATNLDAFKEKAIGFIEKIKTDLQTDQDFADADSMGKFLKDGEERLALAKEQALAQTASIDELFRAIDFISGEMRVKRLTLEKLVKSRKDQIRVEIQESGRKAFAEHIAALNTSIGKPYMPVIPADFVGVTKSLRTIASLRDAVGTELARAKMAADEVAVRIQTNLNTLRDLAIDYKFLFADAASIVLKGNDDLTALVRLRIAEHKEEEQRKAVAAEREREAAAQTAAPAIPQGGAGGQPGGPQGPIVTAWPQRSPTVAGSPPAPATGDVPPNCTYSPERGLRQIGPHDGAIGTIPNPTNADLADPIFEAIWQATKSWDVNVPEHYVGYCGMSGSHVMLILNAIRAIKPAGKKTSKKKGR